MQLLEQLACGYSDLTESDVFVECASVMGYLECMDDMTESGILTESIVTEGIDIKAIGRKIIQFIQGMLKKVIQMLSKAGNFFRIKAKQFKSKFSKKKTGSSSTSEKQEEPPKETSGTSSSNKQEPKEEPDQDDENQPKHANPDHHIKSSKANRPSNKQEPKEELETEKDPKKSKEEIANEVLKDCPYPGPFAGNFNIMQSRILDLTRGVYSNATDLYGDTVSALHRILVTGEVKKHDDIEDEKDGSKYIDRMANDTEKVTQYLFSIDDEKDNIAKEIKSPEDAKKVCMVIYNDLNKRNGHKTELDYRLFNHYLDRYESAVKNSAWFCENLVANMARTKSGIDKILSKLNDLEKLLKDKNDADPVIQKIVVNAQKMIGITTQCFTGLTIGVNEFTVKMDKDLAGLEAYFTSTVNKLNAAGVDM